MNEMNFVVGLTVQLEVCVAVTKAEADEMEGQVEERGLMGSMTTAQLVAYDKVVDKLPGEPVSIEDWSVLRSVKSDNLQRVLRSVGTSLQ